MEIPACWSCWPVWVFEWQWGLGAWPPPTWHWLQPGFKESTCHWLHCLKPTKYRGKDEVLHRGCCCLHALPPSLLPIALVHQPSTFSSCVSVKSNTPLSFTGVLNLHTWRKPCGLFICLPREQLKVSSSALRPWKRPLQWLSTAH